MIESTGESVNHFTNIILVALLIFTLILATSRKGLWIFIHFA